MTPPDPAGDVPSRWFVSRDREEELAEFVRGAAPGEAGRTAVVFQRPLPYLYLARSVFADAGQPYQALDSLPLAAEPFAAALDVIFAFVIAGANRASTVESVELAALAVPASSPARSCRFERASARSMRGCAS